MTLTYTTSGKSTVMAVDTAPGQVLVLRDSQGSRWPTLVTAVARVDLHHMRIEVTYNRLHAVLPAVSCHHRFQVLPQHHAVCSVCGQLPPCQDERVERSTEDVFTSGFSFIEGLDICTDHRDSDPTHA